MKRVKIRRKKKREKRDRNEEDKNGNSNREFLFSKTNIQKLGESIFRRNRNLFLKKVEKTKRMRQKKQDNFREKMAKWKKQA